MTLASLDRRAWPAPAPSRSGRAVTLLDLDPDLGASLRGERLVAARSALRVRLLRLPRGEWAGGRLASASRDHLGLLLLDGAIAREVVLEDTVSTELLGPADVIRPWAPERDPRLLIQHVRWQVLADVRLAVLDRTFATALLEFPEVNSVLVDRLVARSQRLATMKAISSLNVVDRRLLALFWHLAERWGRITPDGVVVPLTLSHRLLGELVGARRPTVTTALGALARAGSLVRRDDATWLIREEPSAARASTLRVVSHRRRLLRGELTAMPGDAAR